MKKIAFSNVKSLEAADFVFIGVADETGSHSYRKGSSKAPDRVRKISEREVFVRKGKIHLAQAQTGLIKSNVFDAGNVVRKRLQDFIADIVQNNKIPIVIGGDHSITTDILKGFDSADIKVGVVYFDAHPDFVCSSEKYYGSVICDIREYRNVDFKHSIEIGVREPETEEIENLRKSLLKIIRPIDIAEKGVVWALKEIKNRVGKNEIYISIDMDVLDPAFAPGVSTPVPGGLSSNEFLYIISELAKMKIAGMDIVEINPKFDVNDSTPHLAVKIIGEVLAGKK